MSKGRARAAFKKALARAAEKYQGDPQLGSGLAVWATWEFVAAQTGWCAEGLDRPLADLAKALGDLRDGRTVAMLRATPVAHRRMDSAVLRSVKGWAIATVDQLRGQGVALESACRAVARTLEKHGVPLGTRADTPAWRSVRRWRERATKISADDPQNAVRRALARAKGFSQLNQCDALEQLDLALRTLVEGPLD